MSMKKSISIITLCILSCTGNAQMIKKFNCVKTQEDSVFVVYSLKVKFASVFKEEKRLSLVKTELVEKFQIDANNIISIESYLGKKYLTYLYRLKVKKRH